MGLFRKKETTHFERDPEGRVTQVTRNGRPIAAEGYELVGRNGEAVRVHHDPVLDKMKSTRQLESEYYEKHPGRKHPTLTKIGSGLQKLDKGIVKYNRTRNIMGPQQRHRRNPPSDRNANPFGNMFDTGFKVSKPRKKKTKKFAIVGGKAYPIAGIGKKKKKKSTRRKRSFGFDSSFDPFDNSRWF